MISKAVPMVALLGSGALCHAQTSPGQTPPPPAQNIQNLTPPVQPKIVPVQTPPEVPIQPPPGPSAVGSKPITAEDAALIALKHQPQIAIAQAALKAARGNALEASSLLLPQITVDAGYLNSYQLNRSSNSNSGSGNGSGSGGFAGSRTGFSSSISLSQLIFDFGKTLDQVREQEAFERAAGFALTASESDNVFTAKQSFYAYVQALRTVDAAQANLNDAQSNLDLATARLNTGLGTPADVVTAQTTVAANTVTLITDRNAATQAQVALTLSMGIDPRTPIVPADSQERALTTSDSNALVDEALKQRPDIKQQEQDLRAAGYEVSVARKYLLPSVSLTASVSTDGPLQPFTNQFASYGVQLTWNPLDILGYRGRINVAEGAKDTAQAQLQQQVLTVISQVTQAFLNEKNAEQQLVTATSELANATEGLRISEGQFRAGLATFVVVINAEASLATARADMVNAEANLQQARAAMEHALGRAL